MNMARLVYPGFWFGKTPIEEALTLARRGVGGFCLYGGTRQEIADFTAAVREASPLQQLLICADYEDGLGRWVPDAPLLPSNLALGAAADENLAFEKGFLTAQQARSIGVDWIFAPVLDLADNPLNPIVNTRSFGKDPALVTRLGSAFLKGIEAAGALNSVKHFPGHGDTTVDSHLALPVLNKTKDQLYAQEIRPFQALLPQADSVMLGHLLVPDIDKENPASLSPKIAFEMLRKELNYQGCVLTDALLMKAIGDERQAAWKALEAGVNILLVPQNPNQLIDFLEEKHVPAEILNRSHALQDALCAKSQRVIRPTVSQAFGANDLTNHTAQKAITLRGPLTPLPSGQKIHYLVLAGDKKISVQPFLDTLSAHHIETEAFVDQADCLLVLCLRRYKAFEGKIALAQEDISQLKKALLKARQAVCVLLDSPWAMPKDMAVPTQLFTFCPAPEFQKVAAEILLGKRRAQGKAPIDL